MEDQLVEAVVGLPRMASASARVAVIIYCGCIGWKFDFDSVVSKGAWSRYQVQVRFQGAADGDDSCEDQQAGQRDPGNEVVGR